jgi:short subunit dehydrogenase-like uncharacterized protein
MNPAAEFDLIVYGATGYTGRLVAEHLSQEYGIGGEVKWAMAGRSVAKLEAVRDEIRAPSATPLVVADADKPAELAAMVRRAKAIITTVGPYQLYGSSLVAACAEAGTDYLDLSGEPNWMRAMIDAHHLTAQTSGARILFSCGFDSIPFELGVWFCQETAKSRLGAVVPRVKGRVRGMAGGLSGGTAASGKATMAAIQRDPSILAILGSPFGLTPGFQGPEQPAGDQPYDDPDCGLVAPFMMAMINTKNVHRSNLLMGHPYGQDFQYDEMTIGEPGGAAGFEDLASLPGGGPKPGEGPSPEEREAGFYDLIFIGLAADGRKVQVAVKGRRDPGYGSTSKMLAETGVTLINAPDVAGGVWTPGAALQGRLVQRLRDHALMTFEPE